MYPFERFTEKAKHALTLAQQEAERAHHSYIGTEHLLLGLMRQGDGLGAQLLANLGVEIEQVRDTITSVLGRNERIIVQQIIPTSRAKKVIEIAFEEAKRMNNTYVGTEHLLLGLLIEGEGIAAHVLEDLGADLGTVRHELDRLLHDPTWAQAAEAGEPPSPFLPRRGVGHVVTSTFTPLGRSGPRGSWQALYHQPQVELLLTSEARSALALAEEEAAKSRAGGIGTEHLVLGLVRQGEGRAARALLQLGVDLGRARSALSELGRSHQGAPVQSLLPTPGLEQAVEAAAELAAKDAGALGRPDTSHLLLAVAGMREEPGRHLLEALGVGPTRLKAALRALDQDPPGEASGPR